MRSARIASPCFTRPRFELGVSSRAPQVSNKRIRLSCSLKSHVFSSIHHDVLNGGLSTPHLSSSTLAIITLGVFDDSVMNSPRVVWQLHLYWVEQRLFGRCETDHCVVTYAKSVSVHGTPWQRPPLPALWCKAPLAPLGERLSFNLNDCRLVCTATCKTMSCQQA